MDKSVRICCRLSEECIAYIGRNRSGIDAGEIDYGIYLSKFERMSIGCLEDALRSLKVIENRVHEQLEELRDEKRGEK